MPYVKIHYGSSHNISVDSVEYFEIDADDVPEDPRDRQEFLDGVWQDAVNEYMEYTEVEIVETEE